MDSYLEENNAVYLQRFTIVFSYFLFFSKVNVLIFYNIIKKIYI